VEAEYRPVDDPPDGGLVTGDSSDGWAARAGFLGRTALRPAGRETKSGGEVDGGVGRLRELGTGGAVRVVRGRCWGCCRSCCCGMLAGGGCGFSVDV